MLGSFCIATCFRSRTIHELISCPLVLTLIFSGFSLNCRSFAPLGPAPYTLISLIIFSHGATLVCTATASRHSTPVDDGIYPIGYAPCARVVLRWGGADGAVVDICKLLLVLRDAAVIEGPGISILSSAAGKIFDCVWVQLAPGPLDCGHFRLSQVHFTLSNVTAIIFVAEGAQHKTSVTNHISSKCDILPTSMQAHLATSPNHETNFHCFDSTTASLHRAAKISAQKVYIQALEMDLRGLDGYHNGSDINHLAANPQECVASKKS